MVWVVRRTHEALLTHSTFARPRQATSEATASFFPSQSGRTLPLGAVQQVMRDLGQAAGVPWMHPQSLFRTAATRYLVTGGDATSLWRRLGHSGMKKTNR